MGGFYSQLCLTEGTLNSKAAVVTGQRRSEISAAPLLAMLAAPTMAAAVELSSRRDGCTVCLFMYLPFICLHLYRIPLKVGRLHRHTFQCLSMIKWFYNHDIYTVWRAFVVYMNILPY